MSVDVFPLLFIFLVLVSYLVARWHWRYRCPHCGGTARKSKLEVGFTLLSSGKKKTVKTSIGLCSKCKNAWVLDDVSSRTKGLIIPVGTKVQR